MSKRPLRFVAPLAVLGASLGSALASGCAGLSCSEVGGYNGVVVNIPEALFVPTGSVTFEVCDGDDCASASEDLGKFPDNTPVGRESAVTWDDLGRSFDPGTVTVTVDLRGPDAAVVAARTADVDLSRHYPNGKACDGDGYVVGAIDLRVEDRVGPS